MQSCEIYRTTSTATKQVLFSKGNLQYQASTNTWRFAEHQYDIIGADNKNISATYDGWIDLFGWGTSGCNTDSYARNFYPYCSSTASIVNSYNTAYNTYGYGPTNKNLTETGANYDWGVYNAISNGGNQKGQWRVLTADEWKYLYSGRKNAASLRTKATVEGVAGYIFFPDNWKQPEGVSVGLDADAFTTNAYSELEWNILDARGAIFLPAAGSRSGTTVNNVGYVGSYWSSTVSSKSHARNFFFDNSSMNASNTNYRYMGNSVRLILEQY